MTTIKVILGNASFKKLI